MCTLLKAITIATGRKPGHRHGANMSCPAVVYLFDLGPHLLDQVLYLFGIPNTITADIRKQRPHAKVDDYFDLRFDYGFLKVILTGWYAGSRTRSALP